MHSPSVSCCSTVRSCRASRSSFCPCSNISASRRSSCAPARSSRTASEMPSRASMRACSAPIRAVWSSAMPSLSARSSRFMPAPSTRMPSATAPSASSLTATSRWRFWSCASAVMCTGIITTRTSRASATPRTCISTGRTLRRRIRGCCGSCSAWARARSTARPTTMRGCSIWITRRRRRWSPTVMSISTRSIRWM